jgi:hypothetical protein
MSVVYTINVTGRGEIRRDYSETETSGDAAGKQLPRRNEAMSKKQ